METEVNIYILYTGRIYKLLCFWIEQRIIINQSHSNPLIIEASIGGAGSQSSLHWK